jgi:hypothetical protein
MKFYVASKLDDRDKARKVMEEIRAAGHEGTLDCTKDTLLEKPYSNNEEVARYRAERDIKAVIESDVFVLIAEEVANNKGMYVELGAAIASQIKIGKPEIYVVGEYADSGVFFFHPRVKRVRTINELFSMHRGC